MKRSDLYREWARVLDMCEGTGVDPLLCWKYNGRYADHAPALIDPPECYQFAVAILEGEPVFVGDDVWTWDPPKRTFTLNGEKLPCPVQPPADWGLLIGSTMHYFKSEDDYKQIRNAINKILNEAL